MFDKYIRFVKGISVNRIGQAGVVLTTSSFFSFLFFELLRLSGVLTNAYIGLVTYLVFPAMFITGLILIPFAWKKFKKDSGKTLSEIVSERFEPEQTKGGFFGAGIYSTVLIFTILNIVFMSLTGFRTLKFMDEPKFCGTACHSVMGPEWATYQQSPHSRVKCVECHVGEGVDALVSSKLNGLRQMALATFNAYSRPIPTPVHQLRPSRETCEKCHWPDKFYGTRLKIITRYSSDENNTPRYNTLNMKIDTGSSNNKSGIHWHVGEENEVRYASTGDKRKEMIWVDVKQKDGTYKRFENRRLVSEASEKDFNHIRQMDCVDCHNRATHIYENPSHAIEDRLSKGLISRDLPFIKRELLRAITFNYTDREHAVQGIRDHLYGFYRRGYKTISISRLEDIDQAVLTGINIYTRNVHHEMNLDWGQYPSHIGHDKGDGCFRCHNENMVDQAGNAISYDCTLCHSILSHGENDPFQYLKEPDEKAPEKLKHQFLKKEFFENTL